ncbi:MAG: flagellar hook-associated protein FlgK [Magnetococcus sp. DMHC-1]
MAISNILNSSKLGLFANQGALKVVSHNIANANTPGYSRQVIALEANPKSAHGREAGGEGVQISEVNRKVDDLVDRRLRLSAGENGRLEARDRFLTQIENVFNEMNGEGFASRLEKFFDAVDNAADNPANTVARAQVVSDAQSLTLQANKMHKNLSEMALPIDKEINVVLEDLNSQLKNFRDINLQVIQAKGAGTDPLDLLDQRQQMLDKLSGMIDVQVLEGANGGMMLQTGSGQLLVDDQYVTQLSRNNQRTATGFDGISIDGKPFDYSAQIGGGALKGLLEIRDQVLQGGGGYLTRLENLVDEVRFQVNVVHSQSVAPAMYKSQTGLMVLGKELTKAVGTLVTDASSPLYQGGPTDLSRVQKGTITFAYGPNADNLTLATVNIDPATQSLTQIRDVLNASPAVTATITADNRLQISSKVIPGTPGAVPAGTTPVATTGVYGVVSDTSNILAALGVGALFGGNGARDMVVNPALLRDTNQLGISRVVTDSASLPRFDDVSNAGVIAMGALRTANFNFAGHSTTFSRQYADIVGDVGVDGSQTKQAIVAQKSTHDFLQEMRDSVSGVSMEEELTDLVKFQRAFQASSKMVSVADELLQSILGMAR